MKVMGAASFAENGFKVRETGKTLQIASMTLKSGETSGDYSNEHPNSEQVLYVIEGEAKLLIENEEILVKAGEAFLIGLNKKHQVINDGPARLLTLNVYSPPAY